MIKDGDKILVCLSGSSSSLCTYDHNNIVQSVCVTLILCSLALLHAVRQFSRARGLHIEIGAMSIGTSGVDPRALMLYLRDLDVKFFVDQISKFYSRKLTENKKNLTFLSPP